MSEKKHPAFKELETRYLEQLKKNIGRLEEVYTQDEINKIYWFYQKSDSLSGEVKQNFDSLWDHVVEFGLLREVIVFTCNEYQASPGIKDDEERFMRALHYAMDEWDL